MYMIQIDESVIHPAVINGEYIRADVYDPTKNTPVVINMHLGGKRRNRYNRITNKKRINKNNKKINKKNKRTNKRKNNSTKRILK